jgi:glycosyltransferase involved in cell wall biosynthesis
VPGLKRLVEALQLEDFVDFTGYLVGDDLLRHIASFDICVTPDPGNAYNDSCTTIKTMEYMAMAKPIVAFDLPENRISAGDSALYATGNSEQDLARLIARLIDQPEERAELGRRGRERVLQSLRWEHQALKLIQLYDQLLCPSPQPADKIYRKSNRPAAWQEAPMVLETTGDRT